MSSAERPLHTPERHNGRNEYEHSSEVKHGSLDRPKSNEHHQDKAPEHRSTHNLESIHHKIEQAAHSQAELKPKYQEKTHDNHTIYATQGLKSHMFSRTLARTRKHLNKPDRVLSKFVHNPTVNTISSLGEKTIARPSGLLAGSVVAFIGVSVFYYLSKHYGFAYNWLLIVILFIGGYALGYILEVGTMVWRKIRS